MTKSYDSEYWKRFYQENSEKIKDRSRKAYHKKTQEQKIERLEALKSRRQSDPSFREHELKRSARARIKLKETVIQQYGGCCKCCGETELDFLSIDHILNDGALHRKSIPSGSGVLYRLIKDKNDFSKYQVLCFNCNMSKKIGKGKCIHERNKRI